MKNVCVCEKNDREREKERAVIISASPDVCLVLIHPGHSYPKFDLHEQLDLVRSLKTLHFLSRRLFQCRTGRTKWHLWSVVLCFEFSFSFFHVFHQVFMKRRISANMDEA